MNNFPNTLNQKVVQNKNNYVYKDFLFHISSRDRDRAVYPQPNEFQVKFAPPSNSRVHAKYNALDATGQPYVAYEDILDFKSFMGASIPITVDNISNIDCVDAIVPQSSRYFDCECNGDGEPPSATDPSSNINDEPFLLLKIDELDPPYYGTNDALNNCFAKLMGDGDYYQNANFIRMLPSDEDGGICYEPGTLGKLNILTMRVESSCGGKYNFGQDKIWIESIEDGGSSYEFCSGAENPVQINITSDGSLIPNGNDYGCGQNICGHGLVIGDLIYFYDRYTCKNKTIRFVNPSTGVNQALTINVVAGATVDADVPGTSEKVDFRRFMRVGDFVVVSSQIRRIVSMTNVDMTLAAAVTAGILDSYSPGVIQGANNKDNGCSNCLLRHCGVRVIDVIDKNSFVINIPYSALSNRYDNLTTNGGTNQELFFIKDKLQINYTLKVRTKENDNKALRSFVVNQGIF